MKTIYIAGRESREVWDPKKEEFVTLREVKPTILKLEHSLLAISKWESKYHKPFLGKGTKSEKTSDEMFYYIQCMALTPVDPDVYLCLTQEQVNEIADYISDPMTATTISSNRRAAGPQNTETITSELIYYWMTVHQIPFECQKWHINRLMMLIQICNIKNSPSKKMSKRDILAQNRSLNAARRAKHHSHG